MLDIIHFHPNGAMAKKFVLPLMSTEERVGLRSELITSSLSEKVIKYDLALRNILILPYSFLKIIKIIRNEKPSIVISHNTRSSLLPLLAAKICRIKRIVYFNHGAPYLGHRWMLKFILILLEKFNLYLANETITVSTEMVTALKKISDKEISLINFGSACGIEAPIKGLKDRKFKCGIGLKTTDFIIAFVGRPIKRKGYNLTIQMWEKFFANKEGYKLLIYGGVDQTPKKLSWIRNIKFMGFSDNIERVISNIDCLILPSYHEGLSYIALEASVYGCTVIASEVPGLRCIIKNGKNGFLIPSHKIASYAKIIEHLRGNPISNKTKEDISKEIFQKYNRENFMIEYSKFLGLKSHQPKQFKSAIKYAHNK